MKDETRGNNEEIGPSRRSILFGLFFQLPFGVLLVLAPILTWNSNSDLSAIILGTLFLWSAALAFSVNFIRLLTVRLSHDHVSHVKWVKRVTYRWDQISKVEWSNLVIFLHFGKNEVRLNRLVFEDPAAAGEMVLRSLADHGLTANGEKANE
jgi:hypothetical protein